MRFLVRGGKKLRGEIAVRGAKNSALKIMAASLLFDGPVVAENVPQIEDVFRMKELLANLGAKIRVSGRKMRIDTGALRGSAFTKAIAERLRASIVLVGPLLARRGEASFPYPGGCVIGRRPIDIFLDGWRAMGARVKEAKGNGFELSASPPRFAWRGRGGSALGGKAKKLKGADFTFRVVSVTGTEALMMTAVLAEGKTVLRNSALEPEIHTLADFLNASGAKIKGAGTPTIEIVGTGGKLLKAKGVFRVIPDRIEAGSFLILGAALGKNIKVVGCEPNHMSALLTKLHDAGVVCEVGEDWVAVRHPKKLSATNIQTREYPGFPTDLQAPFAVLMTQAEGESVIFETIFENRFGYIEDLKRMGADIFFSDPHRILVKGPTSLRGRDIESPDIRAGLAFVVASLLAGGQSTISNVYQIDRGYEKIDERLRKLGADIERVE